MVDYVPAFIGNPASKIRHAVQLAVEVGSWYRLGTIAVSAAALCWIGAEQNGDGRQARSPGKFPVSAPPVSTEADCVNHGGEATSEACGDNQIKEREGVG
jgi:hypothetical protein